MKNFGSFLVEAAVLVHRVVAALVAKRLADTSIADAAHPLGNDGVVPENPKAGAGIVRRT